MPSDIWQPKIDAYVDAELSDAETRAMDAHLRECSACAADALGQLQLKRATQVAARRYVPSTEFRRRVADSIQEKTASRATGRKPLSSSLSLSSFWRGKWSWAPALAVAIVVLVVAGIWLNRAAVRAQKQARSQQLLAEVTDLHVANLAASSPVDVVSSDRHTVKPWFQGKVPFSFNPPELAGSPFTLVGGRLTYLDHEPGAHLIYNVGAHHISVFIFRAEPALASGFSPQESSQTVLNIHVESWSAGELRYFVVGDASEGSIRQLVGLWQKAS